MDGFGRCGVALAVIIAVTASCAPNSDRSALDGSGGREGGRSVMPGGAMLADLGPVTRAAFLRNRVRKHEIARGLMESGLTAGFPDNLHCPEIDHIFGEPWQGPVYLRRSSATRHHGADIPATDGTPILAMADGMVIARFTGSVGFRGYEIIIRHAPADTGLPVWLYTSYSHFSEMPKLALGQRVRMGQPLGPTGTSGIPSDRRVAHLHLSIHYSRSAKFVGFRNRVVPVAGHYVDVLTLMRRRMPLDTGAMLALSEAERRVPIPHRLTTGATVPPDTRIIWPYACRPI